MVYFKYNLANFQNCCLSSIDSTCNQDSSDELRWKMYKNVVQQRSRDLFLQAKTPRRSEFLFG